MASRPASRTHSRISSASCSTQPGSGKYCGISRYPRPTTRPSSLIIRHVTPVVPSSIARMWRMLATMREIEWRIVYGPVADDRGNEARRGHIECGVEDIGVGRRGQCSEAAANLVCRALFDDDGAPAGGR